MIPVIESFLSGIIESRLKYLQGRLDIVDRIFSEVKLTERNRLKEFISQGKIRVVRGFPRDQSYLPAFVILLGNEQERNQNLGGYVGDDEDSFETEERTETLEAKRSGDFIVFETTKKPVFNVSSILYEGAEYLDNEIFDNRQGTILPSFDIEAGETAEVTYAYKSSGTEQYGAFFNSQYKVETWTANGDLTVILYHLLKWIFLTAREELTEKGLVEQSLSGTDFEPLPEYFPEFVYRRALALSSVTEAKVDKEFTYISDFIVDGDLTEEG